MRDPCGGDNVLFTTFTIFMDESLVSQLGHEFTAFSTVTSVTFVTALILSVHTPGAVCLCLVVTGAIHRQVVNKKECRFTVKKVWA